MEENVLVLSTRCSFRKIIILILLIGIVLLTISYCSFGFSWAKYRVKEYNSHDAYYHVKTCLRNDSCIRENFTSALHCGLSAFLTCLSPAQMFDHWNFPEWEWGRISFVASVIIALIVYFWLKKYELTVTDKRVYGKAAFGKRVDIPNDSISSVSTTGFLNSITVASSSGKINFMLIKNKSEIYDVINNLLISRQNHTVNASETKPATNIGTIEELKQYKELLETGVITQEEFDAKKKQLLGL